MRAAAVGMTVTSTGLLGLMVAKLVAANSAKTNPYLHGSARWANQQDIEKAGLLPRPITFWQQLTGQQSPQVRASMWALGWIKRALRVSYDVTVPNMCCVMPLHDRKRIAPPS